MLSVDHCFPQVKRSIWELCLSFKISKFALQLNQSYYRPQFPQTMSSRFQRRTQDPVKYLMWSALRK